MNNTGKIIVAAAIAAIVAISSFFAGAAWQAHHTRIELQQLLEVFQPAANLQK